VCRIGASRMRRIAVVAAFGFWPVLLQTASGHSGSIHKFQAGAGTAHYQLVAGLKLAKTVVYTDDPEITNYSFHFRVENRGSSTVDPEIGKSRLLVNVKELRNWDIILGNGVQIGAWSVLPPGETLEFNYSLARLFLEPGEYVLEWRGLHFHAPAVTLRVIVKR
jgi:hypothetical protein